MFFFECYGDHRDLHVLTHSFPTLRSSDLRHAAQLRSIRKRDGVVPVSLRKLSVKWLWLAKPTEIAISAIDCSAPSNSSFARRMRSEEHTSELQSLMRISYAVFCLTKKKLTHPQPMSYLIMYATSSIYPIHSN